jgi:endonuclease/exonuclease/phosphatase family metal-dependent hydrolase
LDHESAESRIESTKLIVNKINEFVKDEATVVFLTGDFNASANDACFLPLTTNQKLRFSSANKGNQEGTFNNFTGTNTSCIDYILHNSSTVSESYYIIKDRNNQGRFPSDHFPIFARLAITSQFQMKKEIN